MYVDTEEEGDQGKGKKRKATPPTTDVPEEDEPEVNDTNNVVEDILQSHREVEDKNSALESELQASRVTMRLLAKHQGIEPHEVEDFILAMEMKQMEYSWSTLPQVVAQG